MKTTLNRGLVGVLITLGMSLSLAVASGWDDLAQTPPMGWNSWNTFRLDINEEVVRGIADIFVDRGFKDAGYEYIVIDDGWQVDRDDQGNIMVNKDKFPSGFKALADYIHSKGAWNMRVISALPIHLSTFDGSVW
ncbi:MAG: hypothetical protein GY809_00625 [Planctomycetes bacterium]|nr:hypothetical protein [Planctomycetota bacterium]